MRPTAKIRNLPVEERIRLKEVKKLVREHIRISLELHDYNLRILGFMIGGKDKNEIIAFHDSISHKPMVIDYSLEE